MLFRKLFWKCWLMEIFFQDDGSNSEQDDSSYNMGLALISTAWFWVTLILFLALLAVSLFSLWQHGQLQVFRVVPFDQIALRQLPSEPTLPDNEEQQDASPPPAPPPDLNAWPDEPEPQAQPQPNPGSHHISMTPVGSELNQPFPSLHRTNSVSGQESHQLISQTARILLEMEAMRNHQQRRSSQATFDAYDNIRGSYASGLDQPTGWVYRPGSSQHRRTPSIRRDWSLPPLPDRVASLPRRAHQQ